MKPWLSTFRREQAAQLREVRTLYGLTQSEVARRMGVHRSVINKAESAQFDVSTAWLARMARAIGCYAVDLVPTGAAADDDASVHTDAEAAREQRGLYPRRSSLDFVK